MEPTVLLKDRVMPVFSMGLAGLLEGLLKLCVMTGLESSRVLTVIFSTRRE